MSVLGHLKLQKCLVSVQGPKNAKKVCFQAPKNARKYQRFFMGFWEYLDTCVYTDSAVYWSDIAMIYRVFIKISGSHKMKVSLLALCPSGHSVSLALSLYWHSVPLGTQSRLALSPKLISINSRMSPFRGLLNRLSVAQPGKSIDCQIFDKF